MGAFLRALLSLAIRYIGLLVVIAIGAIIFTEIENLKIVETRKLSDEMKNASMIAKMKIKEELSRTLKVAINSTFFDEMVQKIQDLETDTKPNKWQYMTGAHFAFTIVSTIGYGVIVPTSDATRALTIIYAMFGIPIFLYAMAAAGNVKTLLGERTIQAIEVKLLKRSEVHNMKWKVVVFAITTCVLEMLAASALVFRPENWSYFIAIYYWFITASTIGFGDYVLSFGGNNTVDPGMMVFIFFVTLVLMSDLGCIFGTISEIIEDRNRRGRKKGCLGKYCQSEVNGNGTEHTGDINLEKL